MSEPRYSVLFVCMGNICRSPTAEGVFRKYVSDAGLAGIIETDSAGTHAYHKGSGADRRAAEAADRRGYSLHDIRSRPISADDFVRHDYLLAMDLDNLEIMQVHAAETHRHKVSLLLDFAAQGPNWEDGVDRDFSSQISVDSVSKSGVLAEVAAVIGDSDSNIEQVSVANRHDDCTELTFQLTVKNRTHLARIMRNVRNMPNVLRVSRDCA